MIQGVGLRLCEDTGRLIVGSSIDLYIVDHERARQWGVQVLETRWDSRVARLD